MTLGGEIAVNVEMEHLIVNPEKGYLHDRMQVNPDMKLLNLSAHEAEFDFLERFVELQAARETSLQAAE